MAAPVVTVTDRTPPDGITATSRVRIPPEGMTSTARMRIARGGVTGTATPEDFSSSSNVIASASIGYGSGVVGGFAGVAGCVTGGRGVATTAAFTTRQNSGRSRTRTISPLFAWNSPTHRVPSW
jgi:hypothetical protein